MSSSIIWTPESGHEQRSMIVPEVRGISWNNLLTNDDSYGVKWKTAADIQITPEKALASTVMLACSRILSEMISSMDLNLYRRLPGGARELALESPLHRVIHRVPNDWQTQMEFVEQIVMHLALWGNSYTEIVPGEYGAVSRLNNLHPSRMQVERIENGRLRYRYNNPQTGRDDRYTQDQIMHVRWTPEPDGIKGMVPVEISRDAIALARALEIHASKFWANSARPGVVLQTDGSLTPETAERLRDNWERIHKGAERAYKTAILTNGLKVEPIGFSNESSQFESSRRFQTEEICRIYRLPLHLVQGEALSGDIEAKGQDFLTYTLTPWLRRIEQAISRSLIVNDDMYVAAFDTKSLLRGNSNSRASFYSTMTGLGIYTINDCRRMEGLPPVENGDKHFVAMNTQTLEEAVKPKPDPSQMPGAPPQAQGGVPSQPGVSKLEAPQEAEQGQASQPQYEEAEEQQYEEAEEQFRAFCPTGPGGGRDNSCGASEKFSPTSDDNATHISIPDEKALGEALAKHKIDKLGGHRELAAGTKVALRIDIPAFTSKGVYAVTVHEHTGGKSVGKALGYDSVVRLMGPVSFVSDEPGAEKINKGANKYPLATVKGAFDPDRSIPGDINKWVPVGFNPKKAAYFYDKKTGQEVIAGTDSISVGNSVFVKTATYGPRHVQKQFRSASSWGIESRGFCPTGEGGGIDNSCGGDGDGGGSSSSDSGSTPPRKDPVTSDSGPTRNEPAKPVSSEKQQIDVAKIVKKIAENPWGFTLDRFSVEQPKDGIMVSEFNNKSKQAIQIRADAIHSPQTAIALREWLKVNEESFEGRDDRYVGGWLSKGLYYLDVATRFEPDQAQEALDAGRKASQLAVFNLGTFKQTYVKFDDGDERKPKDWDKSFQAARVSEMATQIYDPDAPALQDHSYDKELKDHGWTSVRSLAVEALVSRGYNVEDAERIVSRGIDEQEVEDGRQRRSSESRYANRRQRRSSVSGVSGVRQGSGRLEGSEARPGVVSGRSGEHAEGLTPGESGHAELRNDCIRSPDGTFAPRNQCQEDGDASPEAKSVSGKVRLVGTKDQADLVHSIFSSLASEESPYERKLLVKSILRESGYSDECCDKLAKLASDRRNQFNAASTAAMMIAASHVMPSIAKESVHVTTTADMVAEGDKQDLAVSTVAYYHQRLDTINLNVDAGWIPMQGMVGANDGFTCSNSLAHPIIHEYGHMLHGRALRKVAQKAAPDADFKRGKDNVHGEIGAYAFSHLQDVEKAVHRDAVKLVNGDRSIRDEITSLSRYATTSPFEAMAEYYAKVALTGERTPGLDQLAKVMKFPEAELKKAAKRGSSKK
jgi:HK97 family phage portal protein